MRSAGVASSTWVAWPLSCTDSKVEKCVVVSATAPPCSTFLRVTGAWVESSTRRCRSSSTSTPHAQPASGRPSASTVPTISEHGDSSNAASSDPITYCLSVEVVFRSSEFLAFAHAAFRSGGAGPPGRWCHEPHGHGAAEAAPDIPWRGHDRHQRHHPAHRRDRRPRDGYLRHLPQH